MTIIAFTTQWYHLVGFGVETAKHVKRRFVWRVYFNDVSILDSAINVHFAR